MASYISENNSNMIFDVMDAQHAKIVDYMNSIYNDMVDNNLRSNQFNAMLDRLEILCQLHFLEEDTLMDNIEYPSAAEHKHLHDLFLTSIDRIRNENHKNHSSNMLNDFIVLRGTFLSHIQEESMPLGKFINDHNPDSAKLTVSTQTR